MLEPEVIIIVKILRAVNPSRPNPGRREKINLKFLFSHFVVIHQKVLKPFEAPQRNVRIKI